jgi:integrase
MVKLDLPYLQIYQSRGKTYAYYRRSGRRVRITEVDGAPLSPSDDGFLAAYTRIHASFEAPTSPEVKAGSLAHLIDHYKSSPDFAEKAPKTRRDYMRYLDSLKEQFGHLPVKTMPRDFVLGLRDKYKDTPRKANYMVQILRLLFSYALDRPSTFGVTTNPAARPKQLKTGEGHRPWEEAEIDRFRGFWRVGTWERTAFELLINTGQRGGDVNKMARSHIVGGRVKVKQSKGGSTVDIPLSGDLQDALTPWLADHPHVALLGKMGIDRFRHRMAAAYAAAGLTGVTTHGLRYTAATTLAEFGLDWETIASITGHETSEMVRKYTAKKRRAQVAIASLDAARATRKK